MAILGCLEWKQLGQLPAENENDMFDGELPKWMEGLAHICGTPERVKGFLEIALSTRITPADVERIETLDPNQLTFAGFPNSGELVQKNPRS